MNAATPIKIFIVSILSLVLILSASSKESKEDPIILLKIAELKSGLRLRYTLSLPSSFSQTASYPLVVALHYGGKVTPFYSRDFVASFVQPALQDLNAIIMAPDCPAAGWTNAVSESSVLELILLLMEEYNIDADRVVLLGYSMGGLGTWYLASRHPGIFSAAIPISAPADVSATPILQGVPVFIIHGEKDELFPSAAVKMLYHEQKRSGADVEMTIVAGASHYELARFIFTLKATIPWIEKIWADR